MEICRKTFELVVDHLTDYTGPIGLSCNNTKLFGSLRLYWDAEQKAHFLVGGVDGPCGVANLDQVKKVIEDANVQKATKVCINSDLSCNPNVSLAATAMVFDNPGAQDDTYCSYSHCQ